MTPELKQRWLTALRSGEFKKNKGYLKIKDKQTGELSYCCLGVLCEIENIPNRETGIDNSFSFIFDQYIQSNGTINDGRLFNELGTHQNHLIALNDYHDTFNPVIEYIEKYL